MIRLSNRMKRLILNACAVPSVVLVGFRQSIGVDERRWMHDIPDFAVGLMSGMDVDAKDPAFIAQIRDRALVELQFRRATGVSK